MQDILEEYRLNLAEQKRLKFAIVVSQDSSRFEALLGGATDGASLQLATEFFVKIKKLMIAASGRLEIPTSLLDKFAMLSGRYFSLLDDAMLLALRNGSTEEWRGIAQVILRIEKSQNLIETFKNELWTTQLDKVTLHKVSF